MAKSFRQRDVVRLLRAAVAAGMTIKTASVEIDGKVSISFTDDQIDPQTSNSDWDKAINDAQEKRVSISLQRPRQTRRN